MMNKIEKRQKTQFFVSFSKPHESYPQGNDSLQAEHRFLILTQFIYSQHWARFFIISLSNL